MQGIDTAGKVAYIGTFSRSIAPSVRIAYLVLPPTLLQKYQTLCSQYSPTVSRFEQHTLFQFMIGGQWNEISIAIEIPIANEGMLLFLL